MLIKYLDSLIKMLQEDPEFSWEYCVYRFATYLADGKLKTINLEVIVDNAWTTYAQLNHELCEVLLKENDSDKFHRSESFLYKELMQYLDNKRRILSINELLKDLENE